MLCLSGFELFSRWVPLKKAYRYGNLYHTLVKTEVDFIGKLKVRRTFTCMNVLVRACLFKFFCVMVYLKFDENYQKYAQKGYYLKREGRG